MEFWVYRDAVAQAKTDQQSMRQQGVPASALPDVSDPLHVYIDAVSAAAQQHADNEVIFRDMCAGYINELIWRECRQPYYKLFPAYVTMFGKTSLEIPARHLHVPYPVFTILFPKGYEPTYRGLPVQSLLVSVSRVEELATFYNGQGFRNAGTRQLMQTLAPSLYDQPVEVVAQQMQQSFEGNLYAQLGMRITLSAPPELAHEYYNLTFTSFVYVTDEWLKLDDILDQYDQNKLSATHETLTKFIDEQHQDSSHEKDSFKHLWRIALSVAFLATAGDKLIEPDVLNKDFEKYLKAVNRQDRHEVERLADKAAKRRQNTVGYQVGRIYEKLLGRRTTGATVSTEEREEAKFEHHWQSLRGAHLHLYWTGPGREIPTLKFLAPTVVRPDLPPPPAVEPIRGSRTPEVDVTKTEEVPK